MPLVEIALRDTFTTLHGRGGAHPRRLRRSNSRSYFLSPRVAALYTTDAQLLPSQSDFVRGTQAIGQFWQAVFDSGVKGVSLTTVEVESCGNTAHEVGKVELRGADGKILDQAKYVVVWKKDGGSWKLHRDIWTTSVVPAKR